MSNAKPAPARELSRPPIVLVQTWCLLARDEHEEVSQHSMQMLLDTFGDMRTVVKFVKANNIII
jgi:hypothetical protein